MTPTAHDDLQDLKDVTRAEVYKNGELAAHLTRTDAGAIAFTYTRDWIVDDGPAVATTLPVGAEPVVTTGGAVPAFFAGLLPEGRRLTALRRGVKTSADDELSLLLGVGGDTVGDVRVVAEGTGLQHVPARLQVGSFDAVRFADLLAGLDVRVDRVGLPGVQDKVSASMLNLPVTEAGSATLLKLNPPEYRHLVENEHFFLAAARTAGIQTVRARLVRDVDDVPGLAVTRVDRVESDGGVRSLAVEDGCQALGLHPGEKYLVSTERLIRRLSAICEAPVPAAAVFFSQFAFAYLSGNGDAHAKNLSVMTDVSGRWQPTPAYDLPSSQPYGDHTMALPIDGRRDQQVSRARFLALASAIDLPERAATRALARVADSADAWVEGVAGLPFDTGTVRTLTRVVQNRQRMLRGT